jgi:hypothetical protein
MTLPDSGTLKPPFWRPPQVWTPWDRLWLRTGIGCVVFGVLAHVLPLFGLQLRKLAALGSSGSTAGTWLIVLGAFMVLYVWALKGRMIRVVIGAGALAVLGFVGLMVIGYIESHRFSRTAPAPMGPMGMPGPMQPGGPTGPGMPPNFPGRPPIVEHPRMDYDYFVKQYGAEHVVRVTFVGAAGLDMSATVRGRVESWEKETRPKAWRVSTSIENAELIMAPVDDLDGVATRLDVGAATSTDPAERRMVIEVDAGKCVPKKK